MAEHVAVQQPATRVVEHADDVTAVTCFHQSCIPQVAQGSIFINLVEVVTVQVDAVWERCVVHKRDPYGLTILERPKRVGLKVRDVVEGPDIVTVVSPSHCTSHHR